MSRLKKILNKKIEEKKFAPSQEDWKALEELLATEKSSKPSGFSRFKIFLSSILVFLTLGGILFYYQTHKNTHLQDVNSTMNNPIIDNQNKEPKSIKATDAQNAIHSHHKEETPLDSVASTHREKKEKFTNHINRTYQNNTTTSSKSDKKITNDKNNNPSFTNYNSKPFTNDISSSDASTHTTQKTPTFSDQANMHHTQNELYQFTDTTHLSYTENNVAYNTIPETTNQPNEHHTTSLAYTTTNLHSISTVNKQTETTYNTLSSKDYIHLLPYIDIAYSAHSKPDSLQNNSSSPKIRQKKWSYDIAIYSGWLYTQKKFAKPTHIQESNYLKRREKEELPQFFNETGISLQMTKKHLSLSAGLSYYKTGEKIRYSDSLYQWQIFESKTVEQITPLPVWNVQSSSFFILTDENYWTQSDTVITYWNGSNFITDTVSYQQYVINNIDTAYFTIHDSTLTYQYDTTYQTHYDSSLTMTIDDNVKKLHQTNTYSYIEVKISGGAKIPINRFTIGINGGIGLGILQKTNVLYLNETMTQIEQINQFQKTNLSVHFSMPVEYLFHSNHKIFIAPTARYSLTSPLRTGAIKQHYYQIGIYFGIQLQMF